MNTLRGIRVLVTGAAGFIGANLARELVTGGAEVHAIIRPGTRLWRIEEMVPDLVLHSVDLGERAMVRKTVRSVRPEAVFHLAACGVSPAHQDRDEILKCNVLGTVNLLEATAPLDCRRFVHMGGSSEYGPKNRPIKECDGTAPVTYYGATKAAASILCRQFARASRLPVVILRPFSVYGYWEAPARLIPTAVKAACSGDEMALTPPGYRRDFIFVEDVVEACLLALKSGGIDGEILNIGSGEQWANEEVVDMVKAVTGREIRVQLGKYPARPSDTTNWVADIRKAGDMLGWRPRHALRLGLEKTVAWLRLHAREYGLEEARR
ncbi:MAG: NAD-dependent epimerase/dehydratase family protein [Deltaproteobacteria bacterium]|nr:NAD-dependent epimerase/dehydratase family protein [Deltaproteobacteria bacterium]